MLIKPTRGTLADLTSPLARDLVLFLIINECSGSFINDVSGGGANDATLSGTPSWADGPDGPCLAFDGSNHYMAVDDSDELDLLSGNFTLIAGIKRSTAGSQDGLIEKYKATPPSRGGYYLRITSGNVPQMGIFDNSGYTSVNGTSTVSVGAYHQIAAVADKGNNLILHYLDGEFVNSGAQTRIISSTTEPLTIGARSGDFGEKLGGNLNYVMIFNRILSAEEIRQLNADPYRIIRRRGINPAAFYTAGAPPSFVPFPELLKRNAMNPLRGVA